MSHAAAEDCPSQRGLSATSSRNCGKLSRTGLTRDTQDVMYLLFVILIMVGLIAMWAGVAYIAYKGWGPWLRSRFAEPKTAPATITGKREQKEYVVVDDYRLGPSAAGTDEEPSEAAKLETVHWFVTLEISDGTSKEFPVRQSVYESLSLGDHGELFWQGERFLRFVRKGEGSDADEVYRSVVKG